MPPGCGLPGRIVQTRFLGDVGLLEIAAEGFELPLKARVQESEGWKRGDEVSIEVDSSRVLVFPADNLEAA
jgi:iron(III) transport system ATP-binding protein